MANYQPFLIAKQSTGLFQYLRPWVSPQDAFLQLENAFVYRGVLQKRNGTSPFGCVHDVTAITIGTGDGTTRRFTGTLLSYPVVPGSFAPTDGVETFSDDGAGILEGDMEGVGTINYLTGDWVLEFSSPPANLAAITATYQVSDSHMAYQDSIAVGDGLTVAFMGTLVVHPILGSSLSITDGTETFSDNGDGTLTGDMGGTGTIDYATGDWAVTFNAAPAMNAVITASFSPFVVNGTRPIMGLKQWTNEQSGVTQLVAFDTRRASLFNDNTECFDPLATVDQTLWIDDGTTASVTVNTGWAKVGSYAHGLTPFTVTISYTGNTMTDDGVGGFPGAGVMQNTSTVDYDTGVIKLDLSANSAGRVFTVTATLFGDYFSGNESNFFNSTNWQGLLWVTNNADRITTFDGADLARPPFGVTLTAVTLFQNNVTTCLDVDVYKNRFLVQRPTLTGTTPSGVQGQSILYSKIQNPTNLAADVPGNGGELSAPTDDFLMASEFLRDQLVIFFNNSTWLFRFTGSSFDPFRFDKINNTKSTSAPYATVPYDERITSMGNRGLLACDGVNVQRYDLQIIDEYLQINQQFFKQAFAQRFDSINQAWMLFPSKQDDEEADNIKLSDKILVYNFLENTWSIFNLPLMCLGVYHQVKDARWEDFPPPAVENQWQNCDWSWNAYVIQNQAPLLLGGGHDGSVQIVDDERVATDNLEPITTTISTTQWNPFSQIGEKVQFGYIDFYYDISPQDEDNPIPVPELELDFYVDNSTAPSAQRICLLDGAKNSSQAMKRIYINASGEFLRMQITSSSLAPFKILGFVLWARQAGRFTP